MKNSFPLVVLFSILLIISTSTLSTSSINNPTFITTPQIVVNVTDLFPNFSNLTISEDLTSSNITVVSSPIFTYTFINKTDGIKTIFLFNNSTPISNNSVYLIQSPPIYQTLSSNTITSDSNITVYVSISPEFSFIQLSEVHQLISPDFTIISSTANYTKNDTYAYNTFIFRNVNNFSYTIKPNSTNYGSYKIYGEYYSPDFPPSSFNITTNEFTFNSDDILLFRDFDTDHNNRLNRKEILSALKSYFETNMSFSNIDKLLTKYKNSEVLY
jgi:hypothetical protein